MSGVFISYRRDDSQALAGRVHDRLKQRFGKQQVFRDIDAIKPGAVFKEVIAGQVRVCDSLVALIGNRWLDAKDAEGRRRLDLPDDFVKAEIREALAQNKIVIPVLVEGTTMPARDRLPPEISALADRNALMISDARFDYDIELLIAAINDTATQRGGFTISKPSSYFSRLWAWLSVSDTQRTLAFIGAGIATLGSAGWTIYEHLRLPSPTQSTDSATGVPARQGEKSTTSVSSSTDTGSSKVAPSSTATTGGGNGISVERDTQLSLSTELAKGLPPPHATSSRFLELGFEVLARRHGTTSFVPMSEGGELSSNVDDYCIVVNTSTVGYLYVIQQDATGGIQWLFPKNSTSVFSSGSNPVAGDKVLTVPADPEKVFFVDSTVGTETIVIAFSETRWLELESTLNLFGFDSPWLATKGI